MISFHEVVKRAFTGPVCDEKDYDLKIFNRKLTEIVKEHGIKCDTENPVSSDDSLADEVFDAALDFYSQVGTYCPDTRRIIKFTEEEIKEATRAAPSSVELGVERDQKTFFARKPEDTVPPWYSVGGAIPTSSEDLYLSISQARAQVPFATGICMAIPDTVYGMRIMLGSPLEIFAGVRSVVLTKEGLRRAGRPGLPIMNSIAIAVSDVATAASGVALGPGDAYEVSAIGEMKFTLSLLNKVAHALNAGGKIVAGNGPVYGGYCGGAEGTAVAIAAYAFMGQLVQRGMIHHPYPTHYRLIAVNSNRPLLWAQSVGYQAVARNTHIPIMAIPYAAAGPSTEMRYYEIASTVTTIVVSGGSLELLGHKGGIDLDSPLDLQFGTEVGQAALGMKREEANEIVKKLLPKYEENLSKPPEGKKYQELFDVQTARPSTQHFDAYRQHKKTISEFGIPLE